MRTTIDIPEDLLAEARRSFNARTNRELVIEALKELIRKYHRDELRRMSGRVDLRIDIARSGKRPAR